MVFQLTHLLRPLPAKDEVRPLFALETSHSTNLIMHPGQMLFQSRLLNEALLADPTDVTLVTRVNFNVIFQIALPTESAAAMPALVLPLVRMRHHVQLQADVIEESLVADPAYGTFLTHMHLLLVLHQMTIVPVAFPAYAAGRGGYAVSVGQVIRPQVTRDSLVAMRALSVLRSTF